ncbi:MAG: beta-hydroxyacyl-ACP dehydratase [Planctomycetes bacterium]|nr:beta-hydroxyacyl-ACP dehydratase [Planctomycetota bacterium]MCH9034074.1 beta-hydroxyacyl-ACP dehydratase [Planctomycetota bacterium]
MPPPRLADLDGLDLSNVCLTKKQIYEDLPHRYEFMLLDGVLHMDADAKLIVAFRDIREDDWWFRGHVPGRPLLPGVLMLEMAAQVSAVMARRVGGVKGFIAFGGIDNCKFREVVTAPSRLYLLCVGTEYRARRVVSATQGVANGKLIFEATITGMPLRED